MLPDNNTRVPPITGAEWRTAVLAGVLLTAGTIAVHRFCPSPMQFGVEPWDKIRDYHQTLEAFRVRPITTNLINAICVVTGASFKTAFFGFQFTMFFTSCLTFYWYLRQLTFTHRESLGGTMIFHLALPVFLAHFEPVFTWDDFWGYIFVPISIFALMRRKYILAVLGMLVAILAREINLMLVPVWFYLQYLLDDRKMIRPLCVVGCGVALFVIIRLMLTGTSTGERDINFWFNFDGFLRSRDTVFSLLISNGFVWLVGLRQAWQVAHGKSSLSRFLGWAAIYLTIMYVGTGVFFGYARESRYFTIPAIILVPLALLFFREYRPELIRMARYVPRWWHKAVVSAVLIAMCVGITKLAFPRFEYRPWHDGNWGYFALHLSICIVALAAIVLRKREASRKTVA